MAPDIDQAIRTRAFAFLDEQRAIHGTVVPWAVLQGGFNFRGDRIALLSMQGIFKPKMLDLPISIRTTPPDPDKPPPYKDDLSADGVLRYSYRGTDPHHGDNVRLREAMLRQVPLVYLLGIDEGRYMPIYPVFIVRDDPANLCFHIALEHHAPGAIDDADAPMTLAENVHRRYGLRVSWHRLHQEAFRQRVLRAYKTQCAICELRHDKLLEAAHILPDSDPRGEPIVPNGLALCSLHHSAFDADILGVRPDLVIEIRQDILEERDGPMLLHGIQEMAGRKLIVPKSARECPREEFLEERYERFKKAV